jgi:hypothetical protein
MKWILWVRLLAKLAYPLTPKKRVSYVQTPFAKIEIQYKSSHSEQWWDVFILLEVNVYSTSHVLSNPQMSGLITTTTATSCRCAVDTHECVTITAVLVLLILVSLTSVLGKGCLHTAIQSKIATLFPSSYILLVKTSDKIIMHTDPETGSYHSCAI